MVFRKWLQLLSGTAAPDDQARKQNTMIRFWGLETARWVGVFHLKGWKSKSSFPPSQVRSLPWKAKESKFCPWDVPGIWPRYPGPLGVCSTSETQGQLYFGRMSQEFLQDILAHGGGGKVCGKFVLLLQPHNSERPHKS